MSVIDPRLATCPLRGDWEIDRLIHDRRAGQHSEFRGTARIAPSGDGLLDWHEEGELCGPTFRGRAVRDLRIAPATADTWAVLFADGRPFHPLDLTGGSWSALHLCGADRYEGEFALSAGILSIRWRVGGPAKDLLIESRYRRPDPANPDHSAGREPTTSIGAR